MSDRTKMKKEDLLKLVKELEAKVTSLESTLEQLKAKQAGLIGVGATKNPLVK
jgi:hypothetical protein